MPNYIHTIGAILLMSSMSWAIFTGNLQNQAIVTGVATIYIGLIIWGSANIRSNFFMKSKSKVGSGKLAITFDDGPSQSTVEFLDLMKEEGVKGNFFLIGKEIPGNEDIVKRIVDEGHVVGNHSYAHDYMFASRSKKKVKADMEKCSELIQNIIGKKPLLFRPPFGVTTPTLSAVVDKLDVRSIGWNIRTHDGVKNDSDVIEKNLFKKNLDGAIVLFHDTNLNSLEVLKKLIDRTKSLGIEIVTLEEEMECYA